MRWLCDWFWNGQSIFIFVVTFVCNILAVMLEYWLLYGGNIVINIGFYIGLQFGCGGILILYFQILIQTLILSHENLNIWHRQCLSINERSECVTNIFCSFLGDLEILNPLVCKAFRGFLSKSTHIGLFFLKMRSCWDWCVWSIIDVKCV